MRDILFGRRSPPRKPQTKFTRTLSALVSHPGVVCGFVGAGGEILFYCEIMRHGSHPPSGQCTP